MGRVGLWLGGSSVFLAALLLGVSWVEWETATGLRVSAGWFALSPGSATTAMAAAAAWGATLLSRGLATRLIGALQAILGVVSLWFIVSVLLSPFLVVEELGQQAMGVELGLGREAPALDWNLWGVGGSLLGLVGVAISGVFAVAWARASRGEGSRYDRSGGQSEHPWDLLSRGVDPTER